MYANESITKLGTSLFDKLTQAQSYIDAGDNTQARNTLQALINQIEAQIDIHINHDAAVILIDQIQTLMDSFVSIIFSEYTHPQTERDGTKISSNLSEQGVSFSSVRFFPRPSPPVPDPSG